MKLYVVEKQLPTGEWVKHEWSRPGIRKDARHAMKLIRANEIPLKLVGVELRLAEVEREHKCLCGNIIVNASGFDGELCESCAAGRAQSLGLIL